MIKIQQRDQELSKEEKLDFAAEIMFVSLLFGSILLQFLMHIFVYPYDSLPMHFFWFLVWSFFSFFAHFPAAIIFGFCFRIIIALIDMTKLDLNTKMILTLLGGLIVLILIQHLFLDYGELINTQQYAKLIIYLLSFGLPFVIWNLYKNIWASINHKPDENPDLLDDIQF